MKKHISNGVKKRIVMLFGTFDILHPGHVNLFWQAQKFGDFLIAVVARDATVMAFKKHQPFNTEKKRVAAIKTSGLADKVILGSLTDRFAAIKKYRPDSIVLGYDQRFNTEGLPEKLRELKLKTKIVRLKAYKPHIHKTSKILKIK